MTVAPIPALDGLEEAATRAVIGQLAAWGLGYVSGSPDARPDLPILMAYDVPAKPNRVLMVAVTVRQLSVETGSIDLALQVVTRGDRDDRFGANRTAGAVMARLHNVHHARWNGLEVARCLHESSAPMGRDDDQRQTRSDNYVLTTQGDPQ